VEPRRSEPSGGARLSQCTPRKPASLTKSVWFWPAVVRVSAQRSAASGRSLRHCLPAHLPLSSLYRSSTASNALLPPSREPESLSFCLPCLYLASAVSSACPNWRVFLTFALPEPPRFSYALGGTISLGGMAGKLLGGNAEVDTWRRSLFCCRRAAARLADAGRRSDAACGRCAAWDTQRTCSCRRI